MANRNHSQLTLFATCYRSKDHPPQGTLLDKVHSCLALVCQICQPLPPHGQRWSIHIAKPTQRHEQISFTEKSWCFPWVFFKTSFQHCINEKTGHLFLYSFGHPTTLAWWVLINWFYWLYMILFSWSCFPPGRWFWWSREHRSFELQLPQKHSRSNVAKSIRNLGLLPPLEYFPTCRSPNFPRANRFSASDKNRIIWWPWCKANATQVIAWPQRVIQMWKMQGPCTPETKQWNMVIHSIPIHSL